MNKVMLARQLFNDRMGAALFKLRDEQKLVREDLADLIGTNVSTVNLYEKQHRRLDIGELGGICLGLKVDPVTLTAAIIQNIGVTDKTIALPTLPDKTCGLNTHLSTSSLKVLSHLSLVKTGDSLRQMRNTSALSLRAAAGKLSIVHSFISKRENSERRTDIGEFIVFCQIYKTDPLVSLQIIFDQMNACKGFKKSC